MLCCDVLCISDTKVPCFVALAMILYDIYRLSQFEYWDCVQFFIALLHYWKRARARSKKVDAFILMVQKLLMRVGQAD